jgi:hypothetical protein
MSSSDVWYVKLANGDIHQVTLDQIDQAFDGGRIDSKVLVRPEGTEEWKTLAELAGLDDAPPTAAPAVAASVPPLAYVSPAAYGPVAASVPPVAYAQAAASVRPAMHMYPPPVASLPPAAYVRPYTPEPASTGAVGADFDDSDVTFRRSRKGWVVAVLGVAAAAGFVCVSVIRSRGSTDDTKSTATAAKPAPIMAPPAEPMPAPPPPTPAHPSMAGAQSSNDSPLTPRFTEQQRQKLVDADKQRDEKTKAKSTSHATGGRRPKSTGFATGGNKFDPLNSAI